MSVGIKESLLEIISAMLSSRADVRRLAEIRKNALEFTEDYGRYMMEIVLSSEEDMLERQMGAILLKQYIDGHWSRDADNFKEPIINDSVKEYLREAMPSVLSDPNRKIQNAVTVGLANIAAHDYPEYWPAMLTVLVPKLQSEHPHEVDAMIQFFGDFTRVISRVQVFKIAGQLYDIFYNILEAQERYNTRIRSKIIHMFTTIILIHSSDKEAKEDVLPDILEKVCTLLGFHLGLPYSEQSDFCLKSAILRCFSALVVRPDYIPSCYLDRLLPVVWEILAQCGDKYAAILMGIGSVPLDAGENPDDPCRYTGLVLNIFDFIHCVIDSGNNNETVSSVLPDLIYFSIIFMTITPEIEGVWREEECSFINDEIDDAFDCSIRLTARDLLMVIIHDFEVHKVLHGLTFSVEKQMVVANLNKRMSESYWWRIYESVMFALGSATRFLLGLAKGSNLMQLNLIGYLSQWATLIDACPNYFLLGRIMWVGGQYSLLLSDADFGKYLTTTIINLRTDHHVIRTLAVRGLAAHVETMKESPNCHMFLNVLGSVIDALLYVISQMQISVTHEALITLISILKLNPAIAATLQDRLVETTINVLIKVAEFPTIILDLGDLVKELTANPECSVHVQNNLLPVLINILNSPDSRNQAGFDLRAITLDLMNTLIKYTHQPLSEPFQHGFLAACKCILSCDEDYVLQSGADCLRTYLTQTPDLIRNFSDSQNNTGPIYVMNVLKHILDPLKAESACKQIGRLCIAAINVLGPLLSQYMDLLLKTLLSKMQRSVSLSVQESLIIVFAFLFHSHMNDVVGFLSSVPGPGGDSALCFVLQRLAMRDYMYYGKYERNLSVLALSKIIEHTILTNDKRIEEFEVECEFTPAQSTSRECSTLCLLVNVPISIKIFKQLVQVLGHEARLIFNTEDEAGPSHSPLDSESDSSTHPDLMPELSRHVVPDPLDFNDPIYNLKLDSYLVEFLQSFARYDTFFIFTSFLNEDEKNVLIHFNIAIPD